MATRRLHAPPQLARTAFLLAAALAVAGHAAGHPGHSSPRALQGAPGQGNSTASTLVQWFLGAPMAISKIGQGEMVQWMWWDDKPYSIQGEGAAAKVFTGAGGGTNAVSQKGFVYNVTFDRPGVYRYHDHNYPYIMTGEVWVKPKVNFGGYVIPWYDGVSYGGASAIIETGDTLTWLWEDDEMHSLQVVQGDESAFSGMGTNGEAVARMGFKYIHTFTQPGTWIYICAQHGQTMGGNITVLPKGAAAEGATAVPQGSEEPSNSAQESGAGADAPPPGGFTVYSTESPISGEADGKGSARSSGFESARGLAWALCGLLVAAMA